MIVAENATVLYEKVLSKFNDSFFISSPRGSKVKEFLATTLCLTNPRQRIIYSEKRKADYGFATGEFLWYLSARNDLEMMLYYNKRMSNFSDDGFTLNSAYGKFIFGSDKEKQVGFIPCSQWNACKKTLIDDNDSRRAVISIFNESFSKGVFLGESKDIPCTMNLQFFIRNDAYGKKLLHLHTTMRSNDVIWGLPYDLFSFTLFQELMFLELKERITDLELGSYFHTAGSLHLYERHWNLSKEIVEELEAKDIPDEVFEIKSREDVNHLFVFEKLLRTEKNFNVSVGDNGNDCFFFLLQSLVNHREKRLAEGWFNK